MAKFGQNWPKMAKNVSRGLESQIRSLFHTFKVLTMSFTSKVKWLAVTGQIETKQVWKGFQTKSASEVLQNK